ncbi:LysR family transcriptional regulator [Flavobacteriaceae bacterium R38]|nr:LysR family transcriptional regulator [Flavobacteriaceae bacterium R38]
MSYQIELRHLKYFLAVAEDLHFRKAAEKLYISQPGLSRQIRQMEDDLNVKLFERNNRNVVLTPAGLYLKKEASTLLKNLENALSHTKLLDEGAEGKIKLGYVGSTMQNVIPDLLVAFRKHHPEVRFSLKEMYNMRQIEALLSQEIDVGFVRLNEVPDELNIKPVFKDTFSLVLPENHSSSSDNFTSLSQLKHESFILFEKDYSPAYYKSVMSIFDYGKFTPLVSHTTVHANTIFKLVENGFGIAIVPTSLKLGYDMPIKFIELSKIPQRTILSAVWNKKNRNPMLSKILKFI